MVDWKGCKADQVKEHNITVPTVPVFPAGRITWFSPDEQKELFKQTIKVTRRNGNNARVMMNAARARLSILETVDETKEWFFSQEQPNGLFYWRGHGFYLSESWAVAGSLSEFMLQSAGGIIRVFPCWPEKLDAKFSTFRCLGGFLVKPSNAAGRLHAWKSPPPSAEDSAF